MENLFQNVLTMSLSAGFLAAVVIGLRWFFKSSPKWVHCALWALVAVRLMLPAPPEWSHSMVPKRVSDPQVVVQMVEEIPVFAPLPPAPQAAPLPERPVMEAPAPLPQVEEVPVEAPTNWMGILAWVWLAGIGVMAAYGIISYLRLRHRVAASVDIGNRVHLCDYIDTPFILGLFRPRIYLPSGLDSQTAAFVLAHEQAHLQRRDHWWKPLGFGLLSIHWFNPMIWAAYILLCRDIEMACDEAVIRTMGEEEKKGYSGALLRCSIPRRLVSICPLAFGEVSVKERIKSVLHYRKPALWLTLLGVAAVGAAAAFFLTNPAKDEEVEFQISANYYSNFDRLELHDYDSDGRLTKESTYISGTLRHYRELSYNMLGETRQTTIQYTNCENSAMILCPENGVDILRGTSDTLTYRAELDENENVLSESCYHGFDKIYTETFTYDSQGNVLTKKKLWEDQVSRTDSFTYDQEGNLLTQYNRIVHPSRAVIDEYESKNSYDNQGNLIRHRSYYNGALEYEKTSVWNESGKLRSQVKTEEGQPVSIYSYSYDETGLVETCEVSWPDGTVYCTEVTTYDKYGNKLSLVTWENGVEERYYYNYIGSNGVKSNGIPKDIYTPGKEVAAHPAPEQTPNDPIPMEAVDVTPAGCILKVKIDPRAYHPPFYMGRSFSLHRKNGDRWEPLSPTYHTGMWDPQELKDLPLIGGYYTADWGISWAGIYGILPAGTYQLRTSLSDSYPSDCSVEFTIEENPHAPAEETIEKCMKALNELVHNDRYHVEIQTSFGTREVHAKSGMNYLHTVYSSEDTQSPVSGELRYKGMNYERIMGCWAFNAGPVSPSLMEWYSQFVFDHGDLELLRDGVGIPFRVAYRPGRELPQRDHIIRFFLNKFGKLEKIVEEGVITEYDGQAVEMPYTQTLTVLSVNDPIDNPAERPDLESCNSFFWENDKLDKVGGRYLEGQRYNNREPAEIESVLDVYRLAQRELPAQTDVDYAMVTRDKKAGMWRVEFRSLDGSGEYVYLDEDGITRLVKLDYPSYLTPEKVDAALVKCRAVLDKVQRSPCYGIKTYAYVDHRNGTGEATISTWVRDEDWVQSIKSPISDSAYVRLNVQGTEFENGSGFWGKDFEAFSGGFQGEQGQFVPWLAGFRWEDYEATLLRDQGDHIQILMVPKQEDGDTYELSFYFDENDDFESAIVNMYNDKKIISGQSFTLLSCDPDTVTQQILMYSMLSD